MAAVAYPQPIPSPAPPAPPARVRPPGTLPPRVGARRAVPRRAAARRAVVRRRRIFLLLATPTLAVAAHAAVGALARSPIAPAGGAGAGEPVAARVYVVQPGDTVWSIAHRLQPSGDERPLVARIDADLGGAPLQAGQALTLP